MTDLDAQLAAFLARCSRDEKRVMLVQLQRLDRWRARYGPLELAGDPRDFMREVAEERVDEAFYRAALYIQEQDELAERERVAEELRKYGPAAARLCFALAEADMQDVLVDQSRVRLGYPHEAQMLAERAYGEGRIDGDWRAAWREAGERLVSLTVDRSPAPPPPADAISTSPAGGEAGDLFPTLLITEEDALGCCPRFTWGDGTHDVVCEHARIRLDVLDPPIDVAVTRAEAVGFDDDGEP